MTTYRQFIENNDNEGATWNWWLAVDGNSEELARLAGFLQGDDEQFELSDKELPEESVDVLVENADENYYPDHNKVDGVLKLPEALDDEFYGDLYKGGICDFFETEDGAA